MESVQAFQKGSILNFYIKHFIKLNEEFKANGLDSSFFNICALFLYFSHLLSSMIFYELESKDDERFHTFTSVIYYLNFTNLIIYLDEFTITIIIYILLVFLVLFISFYIPFSFFCKIIFKANILNEKSFFLANKSFVFLIYSFYWILFHPSLDFLLKLILCQNRRFTCFEENFLINFISIALIILIILNGLLHLILNENDLFLDKLSLNMKFTLSQFVIFGLRIAIIFLSVLTKEMKIYIHICTHLFLLLNLAEYLKWFPFRNPLYNIFYLALITCCEALSFLISSSNYIFVLDSRSYFITFFILALILFKLSGKIYDQKQTKFYVNLGNDKLINKDYFLEEILFLFERENSSERCYFILVGLLKKISKIKDNKNLEIKNSINKNTYHQFSSKDRGRILATYVRENFDDIIFSRMKSTLDKKSKEKLSIKYISFLLKGNATLFKTFFEYFKIQNAIKNSSYLYKIRSELIFENIIFKIDKIETEIKYSTKNLNEEETKISSSEFFILNKRKILLETKVKSALEDKIVFYEKLNNGFENYEDALNSLKSSVQKIQSFKKILVKQHKQDIVKLKFLSILNSILINFIPLAINNEDEIENIRKKFQKNEKEKLTQNIFLAPSYIVLQISFLNDNTILESSKSETIANFFGFNASEFNSINNLSALMPKFISNNHRKYVLNSLERTRKTFYKDNITVLAISKGGFCFPVQIFFAQAFEFHNDFVLNALVRKSFSIHNHIILVDSDGIISSTSKDTFEILKFHINNLNPTDLGFFKINQLIPDLKGLLTEECFNQKFFKINNHEGYMLIPQCAEEIINILRLKSQFLSFNQNSKGSDHTQSIKSINSLKLENKKRGYEQLLNEFISEESLLSKYFNDSLVSWIKDNGLTCHDLLDYFYEGLQPKKIKIIFNLEIKTVYLDETNSRKNCTQFIELFLTKLENTPNDDPIKDSAVISESKINIEGLPSCCHAEMNVYFGPTKKAESKIEEKKNTTVNVSRKSVIKNIVLDSKIINKMDVIFKKENSKSVTNEKEEKNVAKDSSHRESSVFGSRNQSLILINIQKDLLKSTPLAIYFMYILFLIHALVIVMFALLLYILSFNYLDNFYYPLNDAMSEQAKLNIAFRYGGLIMSVNELEFNGFIKRDEFTTKKQSEILINSTLTVQNSLRILRDSDRNFAYEDNLKTMKTKFFDLRSDKMRNVSFADLMDLLLEDLNFISKITYSNDTAARKSFARNMPYYMDSSRDNRDLVQKELLNSKTLVSSRFLDTLVVFCVILVLIKVFEFFSFLTLNIKLIQLINILFRVSQSESKKESLFLKDALAMVKNSFSSFMSISFTDYLLNKEKFTKREELESSKSKSAKINHKKKKLLNLNMRSFSKKKLFLYMISTCIIVLLYYIINYILLKEVENKIDGLIWLSIMINNLNIYSGNIVALTFYQIRDKLMNEIEYNKLNENLQNVDLRQTFFYGRFTGRIDEVKSYIHHIPNQFTEARQDLGATLEQLVNGNACNSLAELNEIDLEYYEFCLKAFNGGFNKGIIGAMNEYLKYVNELDQFVKPRNSSMMDQDNIKILYFLNNSDLKNIILESYLLLKTLKAFLNIMDNYYTGILNDKIINLKIITFVSSIATLIVFLIISYMWIIRIGSSYKICVLGLGLIPYEKITNDEQTIFLIKKFHKENILR